MKIKIYSKKQFILFILFSTLVFGVTIPFVANAAGNELKSTLILSTDSPAGAITIKVQSSTAYTYTISLTNNLASKAPIVLIKPRLSDSFVVGGPIICPSGWPAGHLGDNSEGIGSVVCTEPGLDTSIPNPASNPQYDIAYGQSGDVSFTFTTPSSNGTKDLALYIAYINSSGLMQGTWFSPAVHIVVETITCTSWSYSNWSSCSSGGNQTRSITSSSPSNCIGGSPALSQSCYYTNPVKSLDQQCKDYFGVNSVASAGGGSCSCSSGYVWNDARNGCITPVTSQSSCTADIWSCGDWDSCSLSGVQSRSCRKTVDCLSIDTATPVTNQYCESPSRPAQQVPQDSSAISNQDTIVKATVKLICPLDNNRAIQGSGTVISSSGLILTNKHVVSGTLGCLVGFVDNDNDVPYFGNRQIADIQKVSLKEDVATLKLRNSQNRKLTYIDITKANSNFRFGTKINIYGYPAIFGTNMTYTSGDFSGVDGSYLKTTAIIEHGNSGGGAYLSNGMFIGIPSAVVKGELNSLGYILSINTINAWLGNSSIAYSGNSNQNSYSRVSSVLEDIDLKELGSLEFIIPGTKESKDVANEPSDVIEEDQPPILSPNDEPTKNPPVEINTNESGLSIFTVLVLIVLGGGATWVTWKSIKSNIERL